ncbi:MAG: hypothetical protein AABZ58_08860 [Chloroflexota bacterium]
MPKEKFSVGENAEVKCAHLVDGKQVEAWLAGIVVDADYRMAAIRFESDVYASNGWRIPERILWCAHGSPNIRRPVKTATTAS